LPDHQKKNEVRDVAFLGLTAAAAIPLLRFNPAVDDIWTSFDDACPFHVDHVF
jgi:hypothetical protein